MTEENTPTTAQPSDTTSALKRALAAKKAAAKSGIAKGPGSAHNNEHQMQRHAAAMNKPAFKKMSKRG